MNAPPLLAHLTDLIEAVDGIALAAGCDRAERKAAHALLGTIVGSGETSHSAAIEQVRNTILFDRGRLLELAVQAESDLAAQARRIARPRKPSPEGKGAKKAQGSNPLQARWDLETTEGS